MQELSKKTKVDVFFCSGHSVYTTTSPVKYQVSEAPPIMRRSRRTRSDRVATTTFITRHAPRVHRITIWSSIIFHDVKRDGDAQVRWFAATTRPLLDLSLGSIWST